MREQQNPSTPELHQPLLFAPSELLACGLRDAHHHPLVGVRTEDGVRSWRTSPATAWGHPLVEWARTATSYCSIVLDCDSRESQELACAVEAGYGDLPRPNVAAQRASSGHLHLGWNLRTPVHRGAASRPRPLAALGRIAEYYAVTLRSDRGYVGVLAYNPVHGDYNTVYPRSEPYDLAELARALPAHWRRPSKPADLATAPGRNCALFAALCKLALGGSDEGMLIWARTLNREFSAPPWPMLRFGASGGLSAATGHAGASKGISKAGSGDRRAQARSRGSRETHGRASYGVGSDSRAVPPRGTDGRTAPSGDRQRPSARASRTRGSFDPLVRGALFPARDG